MMVTASPGDEPVGAAGSIRTSSQIAPLLATLERKGVVLEDRVDAYLTLTERLKGEEHQNLSEEICRHTHQLARLFCVDVMNDNAELSQAALQALGFCVYHQDISRCFLEADMHTIIKALCNVLLKTEDKSSCTRALWCLSKQNFTDNIIMAELHTILCAVEHALVKTQFQSMTVEHEGVNVIIKLLEQVPENMPRHASCWAKLVYPLLVHSAHKIRERAAFAIQLGLPALEARRAEIIPTLIPDLKAALVPEMVKLFAGRQELHVLRIWGYFVSILGKALHKGGSLINCLLGVVEQGFKHPAAQVKKAAFSVWNILINNFAMEPEILYNAKRLKVLMQPLKATSAKTESVAHAKLDTWWHLAQRLGPRLTSNFDLVCVPLLEISLGVQCSSDSLQFPCPATPGNTGASKQIFGTPRTPQHRNGPVTMASPATPRLNLPPGTPGSKNPTFKSVQSRGVEMLARLLGQPDPSVASGVKAVDMATEPLQHDLISSPTVFIKLAPSLIYIVKDVITLASQQKMGANISEALLLRIWLSLVTHVKNMVELATKRDSVGVFNDFLRCIQCIVRSYPSNVDGRLILKLLESVSRHIPLKVLGSPSYHSSCAGAMHETPALILIKTMFNEDFLAVVLEERFFCVYEMLIEAGMSTPNTILGFAQSVIEVLADYAVFIIAYKEVTWRLWSRLVNPLLEHVIQSNEVNQGDSLDHDFSAMYACLKFPATWLLDNSLSQGTLKTLLKTWSELYQAFTRCAALVTTAESNQCCEELASRIAKTLETSDDKSLNCLEGSIHMCQVMVDSLDFSAFASSHGKEQLTPSKWTKKKLRPLGNLHSVVGLLASRIMLLHDQNNSNFSTFTGMFAQVTSANPTLMSVMSSAIGVVTTLFTHISQPGLIASMLAKLNKPLAEFYRRLAKLGSSTHVYSASIQQKLEKLWIDILTSIQTRYAGPYDNYFLTTMSPLLEVTILHPRRPIKDHALMFWNATFATSTSSLKYTEKLGVALSKLNEKTPIVLPGWSQSDNVNIINETPATQLIESEASQSIMGPPAAVIPNFGAPSPVKMHGSFLKRSAQAERLVASSSPDRMRGRSPGRFTSPEREHLQSPNRKTPKRNQSPNAAAARRKLPVDEDSMQFVAIAPSPTKKRVLTEHQKEVMRTRRTVIPGLYNDLEQSQDTQAFSDLYTQTQTQMDAEPESVTEPEAPVESNNEKQAETSPEIITMPTERSSPHKASVFNLKIDTKEASPVKDKPDTESAALKEANNVQEPLCKDSNQGLVTDKASPIKETSVDGTKMQVENEVVKNDQINQSTESNSSAENHGDNNSEVHLEQQKKTAMSKDPKTEDVVQEEKLQQNETIDESKLQTPSKNSNSTTKDAENLPQEVTPCKTSQSPVDSKVIVTPVIKLQKMSVQEILKYSPRAIDSQFAKLDVDSSPKVFPSSKEKEKGRTRFRRYKSAEVRSSPRKQRSQERTSSFDDMVIMETQSEEMLSRNQNVKKSLSGKQGLLTSQADLAELAERFELDGIEPLSDETDVNHVDNQADVPPPVMDLKTDKNNDLRNGDSKDKISEEVDDVSKELKVKDATRKESEEIQQASSEESMECIDSQEELIPDASDDKVDEFDTTADSAMETDSQSDYFTANDSSEESVTMATESIQQKSDKGKTFLKKSKQKPDFVLSTLEELTEPDTQKTIPEINTDAASRSEVNECAKDKTEKVPDDPNRSQDPKPQESVRELSSDERQSETSEEMSQNSAPSGGQKRGRRQARKADMEDSELNSKDKRSRRRPRKSDTLQGGDNKSADESTNKESYSEDSFSQCVESKQTKKKKGRGRPRKLPRGDNNSLDESISEESQLEDNLNQSISQGKKRGRGRKSRKFTSTDEESTPCREKGNEPSKEDNKILNTREMEHRDSVIATTKDNISEGERVCPTEADAGRNLENTDSKVNGNNKDGQQENEILSGKTEMMTAMSKELFEQAEPDGKQEKDLHETQSQSNGGHLDNSCEDMFGSYNCDAQSEKNLDVPQKDNEDENSVAVVEVKSPSKKLKKRRSFTKLSRKRNHSPCTWDEDDDVPLAKITHCYLDVEGQSSEDSDENQNGKWKSKIDKIASVTSSSEMKQPKVSPIKTVESPGPTTRQRKRKSPRFSSLKKSPQSIVAKKVLRRALQSPPKKPPQVLSPVRRNSTPISDKKRSPIATRLRAGKLTPRSARQLLSGKMSPKKFPKMEMKAQNVAEEVAVANEAKTKDDSFDDSFDVPLNQYIKQSKSPAEKRRRKTKIKTPGNKPTSQEKTKDDTTQREQGSKSCRADVEECKDTKDQDSQCADDELGESVNSSQSPINKEATPQDPKVGQSLQSIPQRLQFVALTGRNSPTECLTPPENTSPVIPHKFSPRSSSSPVQFAMQRGANQGSPRQRSSPVVCEIPGVFSPSVSPSSGILKRRDSESPSPSNKSRRVSFAEPIEQKRTAQPSSPQAKSRPVTSSPSNSTSTVAAMMPSPLVTTTASRVVSLQSKFITTPSKKASSTSKLKSVGSSERSRRRAKKQSLKVMNTRMLFSRGARAIMASKQGAAENGGKKVSAQEQFEIAALDSVSRGIPVMLSPSSPVTTATPSPTPSTQETPALLTQGTQNAELDSSMDVDFESQEAVFPDLVDCQVPVDKVLHQLTSSMWVRGLEQLIRARNILTVGHLCSLSPGQVKSLPIRSPKVSSLCQVMERFKKRQIWNFDKTCSMTSMDREMLQQFVASGQRSLKSLELAKLDKDTSSLSSSTLLENNAETTTSEKPSINETDNSTAQVLTSTDATSNETPLVVSPDPQSDNKQKAPSLQVETVHCESEAKLDSAKTSVVGDVIEESQPFSVSVSAGCSSGEAKIMTPKHKPPLSRCASQGEEPSTSSDSGDQASCNINKDDSSMSSRPGKRKRDDNDSSDDASPPGQSSPKRKRMVDQLGDIAKELSGNALQSLSTDKLFQAHQHVNKLMDSIMAALKTKCRSPSLESS